jgi:cell division protein FtsZ
LINITGDHHLSLHEIHQAATHITAHADPHATIIVGSVIDDAMGDEVAVTVIATGFSPKSARETGTTHRDDRTHIAFDNTTQKSPQASNISQDHPLRSILPSLEKRLKDQYNMPQEELEIPTLLRKLRKEHETAQ